MQGLVDDTIAIHVMRFDSLSFWLYIKNEFYVSFRSVSILENYFL